MAPRRLVATLSRRRSADTSSTGAAALRRCAVTATAPHFVHMTGPVTAALVLSAATALVLSHRHALAQRRRQACARPPLGSRHAPPPRLR